MQCKITDKRVSILGKAEWKHNDDIRIKARKIYTDDAGFALQTCSVGGKVVVVGVDLGRKQLAMSVKLLAQLGNGTTAARHPFRRHHRDDADTNLA